MPRENFALILLALVLYALCARITLRDRILVETLHRIERKALAEPSAKLLFEGAMSGMTRQLNVRLSDVYSAYIPPVDQSDYEAGLENRFDGIGIVYRQNPIDKGSEILYPIPDSPAFEVGIRSGDRILSVNGKDTKDLSFGEVSDLFRDDKNGKVELSIVRFGKTEPEKIRVRRDRILKASVEGDRIDGEGKRIFHLETEPDIAYLRITTFSDRTAGEVREALEQIKKDGRKSIIIDLRDNAGGYVSTSVEVAGLFLSPKSDRDVIVSTRHRDGTTKYAYYVPENSRICTLPMVVMIDGETASAAEILSAAMQDYHRAEIVGTRSFGKGVVQEIFPLPLGSGTLQLTDASYWRPSNKNIHRKHDAREGDEWGVTPDAEGLLKISGSQRYATLQIRDRRSNTVSDKADKLIEEFRDRLPEEIKAYRKELDRYRNFEKDVDLDENPFINIVLDDDETEPAEEKNEEKAEEKKNDEPFVLQGNAPYYDPQLDRALEVLKRKKE